MVRRSGPWLGAILITTLGCASEPGPTTQSQPTAGAEHAETAPPAGTPPPAGTEQDPASAGQAETVSQSEVETFVAVQLEIIQLQQQLEAQVTPQTPAEDVRALQGELQQRATEIIETSDLSAQRYNEIAQQAAHDPQLQSRLQATAEARTGS